MAFVRDGASGGTGNNNNKRTTTTTPTSPMNIGIPTQNKSVAKTTPTSPMNTGVTTPTSSKSSVGSSNNSALKTSTNTGKTPTSISDLKNLDYNLSQNYLDYINNGNNGDYGNNGGSVGTITANTSYYDDLMKAFMEQNDAARQSMIDAIMSNLNAVKGTYKNQINSIVDQYQGLINENEVNRERTRRRIRENQANRGQLDSGLGRQERLDLDTTYDSQNSQLKSAREQAVNEIMNLIAQAEAEANTNKANVESNYNNALLQYKLANS